MAKARKRVRARRVWLNSDPTLPAFVAWRVGSYSKQLTLADCTRRITLDFDFDDDEDAQRARAFNKLDRLIGELQKFRAAMEEA